MGLGREVAEVAWLVCKSVWPFMLIGLGARILKAIVARYRRFGG